MTTFSESRLSSKRMRYEVPLSSKRMRYEVPLSSKRMRYEIPLSSKGSSHFMVALGFILLVGGLLAVLTLPPPFTETHKILFSLVLFIVVGILMWKGFD